MKSLRIYRMSVFFVAFAGALALAPADGRIVSPFLFLGVSAIMWWARNRAGLLPPRTRNQHLWVNVVMGVFAMALLLFEPSVLAAWFHISVLLQAYTFYTARKAWSYSLIYLLSLVQILVASFLGASPAFLIILLYYLIMFTFSLTLHHLMGGLRERVLDMDVPDPRRDPVEREFSMLSGVNRFFFVSVKVAVAVLLCGAALFFLLPRGEGPPEEDPLKEGGRSREKEATTEPGDLTDWPEFPRIPDGPGGSDGPVHSGFSGEIDLGSWGVLFESEREVLRVVTLREGSEYIPELGEFYLRGVILDRYDGLRWSRGATTLQQIRDGDDGTRNGIIAFDNFDFMDPGIILVQVTARREFGAVRFHVHETVGYAAREQQVFRDGNGGLWARPGGFSNEEVEAYSSWSRPLLARGDVLRRVCSSPSTPPNPRFVDLPPEAASVADLANRLARRGESPWETAWRFVDHLRAECSYSKEYFRPKTGSSPLHVFLFERRQGHCELFASALAVMLRARGIPARVVGGFRGGTVRSELDSSYLSVRESDAHAWVEVWFDQPGKWVSIDPTPMVSLDDMDESGLAVERRGRTERKEGFLGFVMRYDRGRQGRLLGRVTGGIWKVIKGVVLVAWAAVTSLPWPVLALLVAGIGVVGVVLGMRVKKGREAVRMLGKRAEKAPMRSLTFYVEFLKALRGLGYSRAPSQTPQEFASFVLDRDGSLVEVKAVTDMFHRIRYREDIPSRSELGEVFGMVRDLRSRSRSPKP